MVKGIVVGVGLMVAASCSPTTTPHPPQTTNFPPSVSVPVVNESAAVVCDLGSGKFLTDYATAKKNQMLKWCKVK